MLNSQFLYFNPLVKKKKSELAESRVTILIKNKKKIQPIPYVDLEEADQVRIMRARILGLCRA